MRDQLPRPPRPRRGAARAGGGRAAGHRYQQLDLYGATRRVAWKARGDEQIKRFDMAAKDAR